MCSACSNVLQNAGGGGITPGMDFGAQYAGYVIAAYAAAFTILGGMAVRALYKYTHVRKATKKDKKK